MAKEKRNCYVVVNQITYWQINFVDAEGNEREIDGMKRYSTKQAAHRRCAQLNESHAQWQASLNQVPS